MVGCPCFGLYFSHVCFFSALLGCSVELFQYGYFTDSCFLKLSHCMRPNCRAFNEEETRHEILKYKSSIINDTGNRDLRT